MKARRPWQRNRPRGAHPGIRSAICADFARIAGGLAICFFVVPVHAQSANLSGTVAVSSQLVDRGIAVTPATPILQGAAAWTSASGWSLGLSAGTELRSPGHVVEAIAQASHYWSLADNWQMQASLLYYDYPGNTGSKTFDRAEAGVYWTYRDILTFGLSAAHVIDAKNHQPRGAADVNFHWPLAWHFSVSAGAGIAQPLIAAYGRYGHAGPYRYGQAGLAWSPKRWRIELDRVMSDANAPRGWGSQATSPWLGTISWSF